MVRSFKCYCFLFGITVFLASCKKGDTARFDFGSIDLTGVYGFVIPKDTVTGKELYKLSSSEALESMTYLNTKGNYITGHYAPEYFYPFNDTYFLASFSVVGSSPKTIESFLIKYSDGTAFQLPNGFYPMKSVGGVWAQEPKEKSIKPDQNNSYFFKGEDRVYKITETALDLFDTQVLDISGTSADVFDIDTEGEIMVGNIIYTSPTVMYTSKIYSASNSYASVSYTNGFSLVKLTENQIQTFHLYVQDSGLKEDTVSILESQSDGWQLIGCYNFSNPNQLIYVFDKGMLRVNASGSSLITFSDLVINSIELADQSDTHLFISATDLAGQKIFLQITPANDPATYTQVLASDHYLISHFNALGNDNIMFQAQVKSTGSNIFGYISSSTVKEVVNYQNITLNQLITIK